MDVNKHTLHTEKLLHLQNEVVTKTYGAISFTQKHLHGRIARTHIHTQGSSNKINILQFQILNNTYTHACTHTYSQSSKKTCNYKNISFTQLHLKAHMQVLLLTHEVSTKQ